MKSMDFHASALASMKARLRATLQSVAFSCLPKHPSLGSLFRGIVSTPLPPFIHCRTVGLLLLLTRCVSSSTPGSAKWVHKKNYGRFLAINFRQMSETDLGDALLSMKNSWDNRILQQQHQNTLNIDVLLQHFPQIRKLARHTTTVLLFSAHELEV